MTMNSVRVTKSLRDDLRRWADYHGLTYTQAVMELMPEESETYVEHNSNIAVDDEALHRLIEKTGRGANYADTIAQRLYRYEVAEKATVMEVMAKERWGDVPVTVEINRWENGEYQVSVFHTLPPSHKPVRDTYRARLIYDSSTDTVTEGFYRIPSRASEIMYEEEL